MFKEIDLDKGKLKWNPYTRIVYANFKDIHGQIH